MGRLLLLVPCVGCTFLLELEGPPPPIIVIDAGPITERCNGRDDDADRVIDEDADQPCYPFAEGDPGVGECAAGTAACVDGALEVCTGALGPEPEIVNGLDDDCDGLTDESSLR